MFATCGSERKRRYLLDTFPGLRADHIGDSRSTSFEGMIKHLVRTRSACQHDGRQCHESSNFQGSRGKGMSLVNELICRLSATVLVTSKASPQDLLLRRRSDTMCQ